MSIPRSHNARKVTPAYQRWDPCSYRKFWILNLSEKIACLSPPQPPTPNPIPISPSWIKDCRVETKEIRGCILVTFKAKLISPPFVHQSFNLRRDRKSSWHWMSSWRKSTCKCGIIYNGVVKNTWGPRVCPIRLISCLYWSHSHVWLSGFVNWARWEPKGGGTGMFRWFCLFVWLLCNRVNSL